MMSCTLLVIIASTNLYLSVIWQVAAVTSRGMGNWTEIKSIIPQKVENYIKETDHVRRGALTPPAGHLCSNVYLIG